MKGLHSSQHPARLQATARPSRFAGAMSLATALLLVLFFPPAGRAEEPIGPEGVAQRIDELLERHWQSAQIEPAAICDDATYLRRVTLDLAGRIPTTKELRSFLDEKAQDKRRQKIEQLIEDVEFSLHFGSVLDGWIQGPYQGDESFTDYLRNGLSERKSWDTTFREIMLGPWDNPSRKPANRFLDKRAKDLDAMTSDTARVFFGVDITCAKCHDHPLVNDWTQHHFYGMASFFNRTTGGKGTVGEKNEGEVKFVAQDGEEQTARMMFLSGQTIDQAAPDPGAPDPGASDPGPANPGPAGQGGGTPSRREQLVRVALEERRFFSRSFVNRVWRQLLGRGLVEPVDQMHSANEAAIPDMLDFLAEDFAASGYDIPRLVAGIAMSRVYQLSSQWTADAPLPDPQRFAVARLRPLSRRQLAISILLATGDENLDQPSSAQSQRIERLLGVEGLERVERRLELEKNAATLLPALDPSSVEYQSSAGEALFVSNAEPLQQLVRSSAGNLAERLAGLDDSNKIVETAIQTTFSRPPDAQELQQLVAWFDVRLNNAHLIDAQQGDAQQGDAARSDIAKHDVTKHDAGPQDRRAACEQLVWALIASAEFRFNH